MRTKKVGIAGKYGARYGVRVRRRLGEIETERARLRQCPRCEHTSVKRVASAIWQCRKCGHRYAAGAYVPKVRPFRREALEEEGAKDEL
ncbi:MAG: 50S ribosomal protein L37ae [Candidatus Thermoplasmatota archaeon]